VVLLVALGVNVKPKAANATTPSTTQSFVLTRVGEPKGDPPCSTWGDIKSCDPNGASISWGSVTYNWTAPPQHIGPEGISINLSVSETNRPDSPTATGLKVRATGFDVSGGSPDVAIGGHGEPLSGSTSVMLKPRPGAGEYSIRIGVYFSVSYVYTYRAEAATNTQPKNDNSSASRTSSVTATVHWFRGDVSMRSRGGSFVDLTTMGTKLSEGDDISTGADGEAMLALSNGSTVNLLPNTQCNIGSLLRQREEDAQVRVNLKIGKIAARVAKSETSVPGFSVRTPNATASVRGTVFNVQYDEQSQTTTVAVEQGTVDVASNNSSRVAVSGGQQVQVARGLMGEVTGTGSSADSGKNSPLASILGAMNGAATMEPKYLGCYKDTSDLDLKGWLERSRSNTPQHCVAVCRGRGFKYAAVQYGESCLCGNSYGKYGQATNCDYKCTGDPNQICGGYSTNSVYQIR